MFRRTVCAGSPMCNIARGAGRIASAILPTGLVARLFPSSFDTHYANSAPSSAQPNTSSAPSVTSRLRVAPSPTLPSDVASDLASSDYNRAKASLRYKAVPATRASRALGFSSLFVQLGWEKVSGSIPDGSLLSQGGHQRIVDTLSRMRGAVLKLGQMLSIQDSSTVPPHITALFEKVRDQAFAMPQSQLHAVMAKELANPHWRTEVFTSFEDTPIAAASIGQVHHAVLKANPAVGVAAEAEVAVKVQYPGVARSIDSDVANLKMLMSLNILPPGLFVDKILLELRQELSMECQYTIEATKQMRYAELVAADPDLHDVFHVPKVYAQVSTDQVLITEFVRGVPLDKLATRSDVPQSFRNYVAEKMMRLTLRELFTWRFMQTDPNYANFLYDAASNTVNLLDFGAAREYDEVFVDDYIEVVAAAARGDEGTIIEKSIALGFLTGREAKEMLHAHTQSVLSLGRCFREDSEPFDFAAHNLPKLIQQHVPTMVKLRLRPPPTPVYSLHRRLSGTILLATKFGAQMDSGKLFWAIYHEYKDARRASSSS